MTRAVASKLAATARADEPTRTFEPAPNGPASDDSLADLRPGQPSLAGLRPGQPFGHYQILRELGRGGMGIVYEAADLDNGRHVALKTSMRALQDAIHRARFLREGRLAASVSHPNTVYVFGTEEIDGIPVIASELATGGTLSERVTADGPFAPAQAVDAILQVVAGLAAAAAEGVLHRDVKPSNCYVDAEGRIKVGDFGLSISTLTPDETRLTRTGAVLGTPAFASPEQLRAETIDARSDLYAVGATLYYLLVGREPFKDDHPVRLISRVLQEAPEPLGAARRDVARGLEKVVLRCLAKDPADRPQSYDELAALLRPFGSSTPNAATLGLRALAGLIDMIVLRLGTSIAILVVMQWYQRLPASGSELMAWVAPSLVVAIVYFGVSEGLWSASPGKLLVGLRVIDAGSQPLGIGRSFARAVLWMLALSPGMVGALLGGPEVYEVGRIDTGNRTLALVVAYLGPLLGLTLFFSTARRRNGLAALHDLATRTRVVSKLVFDRVTSPTPVPERPPVVSSPAERVGPYVVLDDTSAPGGALAGFDEHLSRRVWIRYVPARTLPVSPARRDVSRPGRLRWLAGARDAQTGWDAYEAVVGAPLRGGRGPSAWADVRRWLLDLASEIAAARHDGTETLLDVDRVWIGRSRAWLLDWQPDAIDSAGEHPDRSRTAQMDAVHRFLCDVASHGLGMPPDAFARWSPASGLPLHARAFLADLAAARFQDVAEIVARLRSCAARPGPLTRARRGAHLAACGVVPMASGLLVGSLLVLVMPRASRSPDFFALEACLQRLQALGPDASAPEALRERAALETYIVGRFRPLLVDHPATKRPWFWSLIEVRRPIVAHALAAHPSPSAADVARAALQLAPLLSDAERHRALAARGLFGWPFLSDIVLRLMMGVAVAGLASALAARGGVLLNLLGVVVVGSDGRHASRLRALMRATVAWMPAIAAGVLLLSTSGRPHDGLLAARLATGLLLLAIFVAGVIVAFVNPQRGWQDRLARTWLVAR